MHLDIRTIIFINSVVQALFAVGLHFSSRAWIKASALNLIALALACGSIGGFLVAYRGIISPFLSIVVANVFILSNPVIIFEGLLQQQRIKSKARIIGPILMALAVPILYYATFIEPHLRARIVVMSAFFCLQTLLCAHLLFTKTDKKLVLPAFSTAFVFVFAAVVMFTRIMWTLWQPDWSGFMAADLAHSILQLSHLFYITGITFGFVWLNARKLGLNLTTALRDVENGLQDQFSFIDVIAHELKTPLATIQNSIESLLMRTKDVDSAQIKAFERIGRSLDRLDHFVDVGLQQKWFVPEQIRNKIKVISIVELIQTAVELCKDSFPDHKVIIKRGTSYAGREDILADPNSLLTALVNVLENAIKFSPDQKAIFVEIGQSDDMLTLAIKDQGCGIEKHSNERVFEKYFRAKKADMVPGAGLGLFIVRHIINVHNGSVTIRNRKSGGCRVDICLPLHLENNHPEKGISTQ